MRRIAPAAILIPIIGTAFWLYLSWLLWPHFLAKACLVLASIVLGHGIYRLFSPR